MDLETRQMLEAIQVQIAALGTELRSELRTELRGEIGGLREEFRSGLRAEVGGLREEFRSGLRAEVGGLREELRSELRAEIGGLRAEMRAGDEMTRRHFDVVAESLRADIRAVAEGVSASNESALRLHHELRAEMDGRFRSLEAVLRVTFADIRREIDDLRSDN